MVSKKRAIIAAAAILALVLGGFVGGVVTHSADRPARPWPAGERHDPVTDYNDGFIDGESQCGIGPRG